MLIRTIYSYMTCILTLIFTVPSMIFYMFLGKKMPEKDFLQKANSFVANWAMKQVKASGAKVDIKGLENIPSDKSVLFVCNHQGIFDILLMLSFVRTPKGFISKKEMLKVPIMSSWMKNINCIFMDRNDIRSAAESISKGIQQLKNGYSLVVFPEGTRSKTSHIGEFKAGSFKLALKSGAPIVPVSIKDTYMLLEANGNKVKPANVSLTIHPLVEVKDLDREEQLRLPEMIKEIIASGL